MSITYILYYILAYIQRNCYVSLENYKYSSYFCPNVIEICLECYEVLCTADVLLAFGICDNKTRMR